jgi:hypothetical protein
VVEQVLRLFGALLLLDSQEGVDPVRNVVPGDRGEPGVERAISVAFPLTASISSLRISWWSALIAKSFTPCSSYRRSSFSAKARISGERELQVAQ